MTNEELDELERPLIEMMEMIKRDYQKQIKPYMDRLIRLRNLRSHTDFEALGMTTITPFGEDCQHPSTIVRQSGARMCMNCGVFL